MSPNIPTLSGCVCLVHKPGPGAVVACAVQLLDRQAAVVNVLALDKKIAGALDDMSEMLNR